MARPTKKTIDYFPHQVKHGKTMFILEQMWGNDGYTFWFKLLEILGSTNYHFVDFNRVDTWEYFIASTRVDNEIAIKVLDKLSILNAIDKQAWDNKIVYSVNFCENIVDAYSRRNNDKPDINRVYDYINSIYGKKLTTKTLKGKESKPKKSKLIDIPPQIEDVKAYCQERSKGVDAEKWFDFYASKGWMVGKNKMVDWKAAVRTWERNQPQDGENKPRGPKLS